MFRQVMKVLPELRMSTANAPALNHMAKTGLITDLLQRRNTVGPILRLDIKNKVRLAAENFRIDS